MLPPESDLSGYKLRVSPDGSRVRLRDAVGGLVATVDARTFAVSAPSEPRTEPATGARRASTQPGDGAGFPWLFAILLAALVAAATLAATRWRQDAGSI